MTLIFSAISLICVAIALGGVCGMAYINKKILKMLRQGILLTDQAITRTAEATIENRKLRVSHYKMYREREEAVRVKQLTERISEELLTRKDTEIHNLIRLLNEKKLKVKSK